MLEEIVDVGADLVEIAGDKNGIGCMPFFIFLFVIAAIVSPFFIYENYQKGKEKGTRAIVKEQAKSVSLETLQTTREDAWDNELKAGMLKVFWGWELTVRSAGRDEEMDTEDDIIEVKRRWK